MVPKSEMANIQECAVIVKKWQQYPELEEPIQPQKLLFEGVAPQSKHFLENS